MFSPHLARFHFSLHRSSLHLVAASLPYWCHLQLEAPSLTLWFDKARFQSSAFVKSQLGLRLHSLSAFLGSLPTPTFTSFATHPPPFHHSNTLGWREIPKGWVVFRGRGRQGINLRDILQPQHLRLLWLGYFGNSYYNKNLEQERMEWGSKITRVWAIPSQQLLPIKLKRVDEFLCIDLGTCMIWNRRTRGLIFPIPHVSGWSRKD